jgi:DNA-binding MarR family transcriptional regulator
LDPDRRDLLAVLAPLTRALRRVEDVAAAGAGITMWQYAILSVVADTTGLNQAQVATRLGYSKNRIVADLDLLEGRQLLVRRPGPDRRANVLAPTAAGLRLMNEVKAEVHDGEDRLLTSLPREQRAALLATLDAITDTLREAPEKAPLLHRHPPTIQSNLNLANETPTQIDTRNVGPPANGRT